MITDTLPVHRQAWNQVLSPPNNSVVTLLWGGWVGWQVGGLRWCAMPCSDSEAGSCLRLIDSCITQLKAQGPYRTCNESKEEEEVFARQRLYTFNPQPTFCLG